jgi:hypothetical protein
MYEAKKQCKVDTGVKAPEQSRVSAQGECFIADHRQGGAGRTMPVGDDAKDNSGTGLFIGRKGKSISGLMEQE